MVSISTVLATAIISSLAVVQAAPAPAPAAAADADADADAAHGGGRGRGTGRRPPPRHPPPPPEHETKGSPPHGSTRRGGSGGGGTNGDGGGGGYGGYGDGRQQSDDEYNPREYPPEYSREIYNICLSAMQAQDYCTRDDRTIDAWCLCENDSIYLNSADDCARSYDANWNEFKDWLQPGRRVCYDFKRGGPRKL